MRISSGTILYDLFKFIVALILLVILILLLLQGPSPAPTQLPTQAPAETATQPISTETPEPLPTQTELPPFPDSSETLTLNPDTQLLETADGVPVYRFDEETGEWVPVIPEDLASTHGPDAALQPDTDGWMIETKDGVVYIWDPDSLTWKEVVLETVEVEPTPAPAPETNVDCPLAKPSRLTAGIKGRVTAPLNIRSSPGIANNRLFTMSPGTELKILGSPICLPHHKGAYLWWQVEIPGVQIGWSAEAPQNEDFYFIDPIE
jgi:hypothetical protein